MKAGKKLLILLFIVLCASDAYSLDPPDLPAKSFTPTVIVPDQVGLVSLFIDNALAGDVEVGIYQNEPVIAHDVLAGLLNEYLRPDVFNTIFEVIFSRLQWITRQDLKTIGIPTTWDDARITMNITIPASFKPIQDLDISPSYVPNIKPILRRAAFSGHLDFSATLDTVIASSGVTAPISGNVKGVINLLDWIGEFAASGSLSASSSAASLNSWYIIHDIPSINGRLFLGRVQAQASSYQSQPELYGFTVRKESIIKYQTKPGFYELFSEFTIETPSIVRIKLNGLTYRTMNMSPGNYRILDLPFTFGLNDFVLEIQDSSGKITQKQATIPRELNLLEEGVSDYSFSAGVGRISTNQPFLSGYFRYGFSPRFTAGFTAQADLRSSLAGVSFIMASMIGNFTGNANMVYAWDGRSNPLSGTASLQYKLNFPGRESIPTLGLSVDYISEGFAAPIPSTTQTTYKESLRFGGQLGARVGKAAGMSLSMYHTQSSDPSSDGTTTAGLSLNQGLGTGASMTFIINANFKPASKPDITATIMLFVLPKDKPGRSMSLIQSGDGSNNINFIDKIDALGGINMNARASNVMPGHPDGSSVGIGFSRQDNVSALELSGDFDLDPATPASRLGRIRLGGSTSLVFANQYLAFTRQVTDSFVLFAPSRTMKGQKVYVRVDSGGNAVSPNARPVILPLTSYRPSVGYFDLPEAPPDMLPRIQTALLVPSYKSGVIYASDILRRYKVVGTLVTAEGKPVSYMAGDIVDMSGTSFTSTFTDEEGNFEIYDLEPGMYRIEWPDFIGITEFNLAESSEGTLSLGTILASPLP